MNWKSLGQIGYEAYGKAGNWQTFDGRDMPQWNELTGPAGELTQRRWNEAGYAIQMPDTAQQKLKLDVLLREYDIAAREYSAAAAGTHGNFDQLKLHTRWQRRVEDLERELAAFLFPKAVD